MCRLLVDCDMNTPTRKALEAGLAPNTADVSSLVGMVGGGEKMVVQVSHHNYIASHGDRFQFVRRI